MSEIGFYLPTPDRSTSGEELVAIESFRLGLISHGETVFAYQHGERCQQQNAVMFGWGKLRNNEVCKNQLTIGGKVLGINFGAVRRDRGYYVAGWNGPSNLGQYYNEKSNSDRWDVLDLHTTPWGWWKGSKIILACQVPTDGSVQSIDIIDWCRRATLEIRRYTDREIIFRPHPLAREITPSIPGTTRSERSFQEDLHEAWAVVTYNSTSSGLAVLEGVPVFSLNEQSFAWGVSSHELSQIENPARPNRWQWACDLAYVQWTLEEMRSGLAWDHLKRGAV